MAKKYYLPRSESAKALWLQNLNSKLPNYASLFGITTAQLTSLDNDTAVYLYNLRFTNALASYASSCTQTKIDVASGKSSGHLLVMPTFEPPTPIPAPLPEGIIPRATELVKYIKAHKAFTDAIGEDLKLIGKSPNRDFTNITPRLKANYSGLKLQLKSTLHGADCIQLECKRGAETEFTPLTQLMKTTYIDKRPNLVSGTPETRYYRCILIVKDNYVGQRSAVIAVLVE